MRRQHVGLFLRLSLLAFCLGVLLSQGVLPAGTTGTPSVGAPGVSPLMIPVGRATVLTVTSQITTNPSNPVVPASVKLMQLDATDKILLNLGTMWDDGVSPDQVAGDGIFTLQVAMTEPTPGEIRLRIDGTFRTGPGRTSSEVTVIPVVSNTAPVANAGPDQTVFVGDTVQLNGSKSSDVDGDRLTFVWAFFSQPAASVATLSDPTLVNPTFVVDRPGSYVVQLIVNDGTVDSAPDTVTISTRNSGPVADAGPDQTVFVGTTVQLDGGGSHDVDGDRLSYRWTLSTIPVGSTATLSDAAVVNPTFLVDRPGTYVAQLIVNDGQLDSRPDTVAISTKNSKPKADAGPDNTVEVGEIVTLDGSGSTDADRDPLTYRWSFTSIPTGSTATLLEPTAVQPTFVADRPGIYLAQLVVNDSTLDSLPDTVMITITATDTRPPQVSVAPPDGALLNTATLLLTITYRDAESGVDVATFAARLDDEDVTSLFTVAAASASSQTSLADGLHRLEASVRDQAGNLAQAASQFTIDTIPPQITLTGPLDGTLTNQAQQTFLGYLSETARLTLNGQGVSVRSDNTFSHGPLSLTEGLNAFALVATDLAGNRSQLLVRVTLDRVPPEPVKPDQIVIGKIVDGQVSVVGSGGSVEAQATVTITNLRTLERSRVTAKPDGSFTATVAVQPLDTLSIVITDRAGNESPASSMPVPDTIPPVVAFTAPQVGSLLNTTTPVIEVSYSDLGVGIDPGTLHLQANAQDLPGNCTFADATAMCSPSTELPQGRIILTATIADRAGNISAPAEISFTVDSIPPRIALTTPPDGTRTNQAQQAFVGQLSEASVLTLNAQPVSVRPDLTFLHGPVTLTEGLNTFTLIAIDLAGNRSQLRVQVTLDTVPPAPVDKSQVRIGEVKDGQVTVSGGSGSAESGAAVTITNTRTGQRITVSVNADGSFTATLAVQSGDQLSIVVTDGAGNPSSPTTMSVGTTLPPDPMAVAPPLNLTVATDMATATAFLYTGNNPIQTGVASGTIEPRRVAVLRGQVHTRDGGPLPGVAITILGHPEYGGTLTRADGMFDMAVNGGGLVTVRYEKEQYLPAQRQAQVSWQDFTWLPDVALNPYDTQVSTIDLMAPAGTQMARGSVVTDARGTRQATLLFSPGTQATMVLPGSSTQSLSTLHVRATEYTVGDSGPQAMPAELPPTSAYTYAVELSADEAVAAGASVQFNQPVIFYVENFLNFPVGGIVPVGYYDRSQGVWVPSRNGRIIKILSIAGGLANLDTNGDGAPDDSAALASLGITDAERQRLAALYQPGQSLWRVSITHFTPWDCNWPFRLPPGTSPPGQPLPTQKSRSVDDPTVQCGSIIACQNQTLGEAVAITGTPFSLHYQSDRAPGRTADRTLEISLTGQTANMTDVILYIDVAGQRLKKTFVPSPNLTYTFTWDGRDGYGREMQGQQPVTIYIGYDYNACYQPPAPSDPSFGLTARAGTALQVCRPVILWQIQRGTVAGSWDARAQGLGGWSLNVHHAYDLAGRVLNLGDGSRRSAAALGRVITPVAGLGVRAYRGDGGPATAAGLSDPSGLAVGPDGSLYIADSMNTRIRRVGPDSIITTVAGTGTVGSSGDGGLATQAQLNYPMDIAVGSDGSLYIADSMNSRIRRVGPDGIISTAAGNGKEGFSGDGSPATQAQLFRPFGLAVGPDGSLYIADSYNGRIRRVAPDGIITTVAGNGIRGFSGDGGPATSAQMYTPYALAVGLDGSLYISDISTYRIRRVGLDGIITTVAGNGIAGHSGDGGPATLAQLYYIRRIALGPDGSLYIVDRNSGYLDYTPGIYIRRVRPDGIITTVAGTTWGDTGDGGLATQATFGWLDGVAVGPDSSLYISDAYNMRVRRVAAPLPGFSLNDLMIPAEDGGEIYVFDGVGRHLRTLDALMGTVRYQFGYGSTGLVTSVTDGDGNVTAIERDGAGHPIAIVAPRGQRTALALDPNTFLASIANPAGETTQFSYTTDGLLTRLTDPRQSVHRFTYDALGLLLRDEDPVGGFSALQRVASTLQSVSTTLSTALGRVWSYRVEKLPTGAEQRTNTHPSGLQTLTLFGTDGSQRVTSPNGTVATLVPGPDARFSMQAPVIRTFQVKTPGGLTSTLTETRTATLANPLDLLSLSRATDTVTLNGRPYTSTFDAASRTITRRTPSGRETVSTLDGKGHVVQALTRGLLPIQFAYDAKGQLTSITQGTRTSVLTYDAQGNLASARDPLSRAVSFEYDQDGRITQQTLPDGRGVRYTYDANGNMTSMTPPGRPNHAFTYTPLDVEENYVPPDVGVGTNLTHYSYNLDRQVVQIMRPDGATVDYGYDSGGRLGTLTTARGQVRFAYHPTTGNLATVTSPDGEALMYSYDGSLLTDTTWSGTIAGSVHRTFDNNFRIISESVSAGQTIAFQYDQDSLLTAVGPLSLTRDPQNGLLTGSTLANVTDTRTYSSFGELASYRATFGGSEIFATQYARDNLGRITGKNETIAGQSNTFAYAYDLAGRLTEVKKNSATVGTYTYDSNGNRLSYTGPDGTMNGVYDVQDRLAQYGSTVYTYTANGELLSKTTGAGATRYTYDALGNLLAVTLPDGTVVEYVVDGRNRRVGKKVNGMLVQGFLYKDGLNPVAELDGSGRVVSRFVYASKPNVPDYLQEGGATYRIISDHLGSPRLVIDTATGVIMQRMDYDAFGNVVLDTNPGFQPFGFAGGLYDQHTKLTRFGARDYDAETGRWTAKDPILFGGGDTNLYGYVGNNPINRIDPLGLQAASASCDEKKKCVGNARVLQGNADLIGKQGGFPGVTVAAGSAAVITSQWGGKGRLRSFLQQIGGTAGGTSFSGITDVIGGESPIPGMNVRDALQALNPGLLILELPSLPSDLGVVNVELTVPASISCPAGTVER